MESLLECQKAEFFLNAHEHYLNCAYLSPTTRTIERAAVAALEMMRCPSVITTDMFFETADRVRAEFAALVNVHDPKQIAIIPSVSYGIATVAKNAEVRRGQRIVVLEEQFPSNVYSWRRLASDRGATVVTVPGSARPSEGVELLNDRLVEAVDRSTAVVAVPHVHWTDGRRIDLDRVGERARDVGALFVIDGSQSVGAVPTDVRHYRPDALICAGYKWLFGPYGMCLGYYGPRLLDGVPLEENWIAREGSENFARLVDYRDSYQPGAIRYDVGERSNFLLLPMMLAGLKHVRDWRPEGVQRYCKHLFEPTLRTLRDLGFKVAPEAERFSHLVGIRLPDRMDPHRTAHAMAAARVSVSVRGTAIRVSPHVYNDIQDVEALMAVLRTALSEG